MSKDTEKALNDIMGKSTTEKEKPKKKKPEGIAKMDKTSKVVGFRIDRTDLKLLKEHFLIEYGESQVTKGIKRIIYQYMKDKKIK